MGRAREEEIVKQWLISPLHLLSALLQAPALSSYLSLQTDPGEHWLLACGQAIGSLSLIRC